MNGYGLRRKWKMECRATFLFSMACCLFSPSALFAGTGETGAAFLNIPVGARPAAMGSAYSALAEDSYGTVWNPGGLAFSPGTELTAQHLSYLESIHYEYAGLAHALKPGRTLAASVQYLGTGDVTGRDPNGEPTGDFTNYYAAYTFAYGHKLNEKLGIGFGVKRIAARLEETSAGTWAGSAGFLYKPSPLWRIGTVLDQVGQGLKFMESRDALPLTLRVGIAYNPARWTLSVEPVYTRGDGLHGRFGLEYRALPMLALRTGYRTDHREGLSALSGFSTGAGVLFWGQELAYAWVPLDDLGNTHYISLTARFGQALAQRRNLVHYDRRRTRQAQHNPGEAPEDDEQLQLMNLLEQDRPRTAQESGQDQD